VDAGQAERSAYSEGGMMNTANYEDQAFGKAFFSEIIEHIVENFNPKSLSTS
jgi:hypothetical protein